MLTQNSLMVKKRNSREQPHLPSGIWVAGPVWSVDHSVRHSWYGHESSLGIGVTAQNEVPPWEKPASLLYSRQRPIS
jgi:hypothetical protein